MAVGAARCLVARVRAREEIARADDTAPPPPLDAARTIMSLVRPERRLIAAGVVLSVASSGLTLAFPAAIGWLVDVTLATDREVSPMIATAALGAISTSQAAVMVLRSRVMTVAGENLVARVRTRAFSSLLRQEVAFFDRQESGELLNRLSADCAQLQKAVSSTVVQALRSVSMALGSTAMLLYLSPSLAALSVAVFPAVFAFGAWQGRAMRAEQKAVQRLLARSAAVAGRALAGVRTLRALGAERTQLGRYEAAVQSSRDRAVAVGMRQAYFDGSVQLAANASMLVVLGQGSAMVAAGALSAGELSSFVLYSMWLGFASSQLSGAYAETVRALGSSERLLELMSRQPRIPERGGLRLAHGPTDGSGAPVLPLGVDFEGVGFRYAARLPSVARRAGARADSGAEEALQDPAAPAPPAGRAAAAAARQPDGSSAQLHAAAAAEEEEEAAAAEEEEERRTALEIRGLTLHIGAGERVGLVGESGCGKSTLLRLISRLYDVRAGAVRVGGVDVRQLDPAQLRGHLVATLPQEVVLLAGSIRDNVALGALTPDALDADAGAGAGADDADAGAEAARRRAAALESAVDAAVDAAGLRALISTLPDGLDTQVGEGGVSLSGGERQRVAIARLLVADPSVVLLDEFSSALDAVTEAAVTASLRALLAGRTVITIAHRESALRGLGVERIVELGQGARVLRDVPFAEWAQCHHAAHGRRLGAESLRAPSAASGPGE